MGSEDHRIGFLSWTHHWFALLHPDEVILSLLNIFVSTMRTMVSTCMVAGGVRHNIQRAARPPPGREKESALLSLFHCKGNIRFLTFSKVLCERSIRLWELIVT